MDTPHCLSRPSRHSGSSALPEPDADARAHSHRVAGFIRTQIEAGNGWLSLHDYMQHALYAPGLGYYVAGAQRFGEKGDFITAPELTPLYARTWATPITEALSRTGDKTAAVLELGAGSGTFAAALLTALRERDALPAQYLILERSPSLREQQQQTLREQVPELLHRVSWLDALPENFTGCIFMNEVLDAMPPRFLQRQDGRWFECGVALDDGRFIKAQRLLDTASTNARTNTNDAMLHAEALRRLPEDNSDNASASDAIVEINLAAEALARTLAGLLAPRQGTLFISDYGFAREPHLPAHYLQGTLRGYYRHHLLDDPFVWPGLVDLTTHVDFTAVADAALGNGLRVHAFRTQSAFLLKHGLLEHLQASATPASPAYLSAAQTVRMLLTPEEMGTIFHVLILTA